MAIRFFCIDVFFHFLAGIFNRISGVGGRLTNLFYSLIHGLSRLPDSAVATPTSCYGEQN
jgi:hypothetical protein